MALKKLPYMNGISISNYTGGAFLPQEGIYQSVFLIREDACEIAVKILSTQPIYCKNGKLELASLQVATLMNYPEFRIKKLIFSKLEVNSLDRKLRKMLDGLENV